VFHDTARPSAIHATVRWPTTKTSKAHRNPRRDSFARGSEPCSCLGFTHAHTPTPVSAHRHQQYALYQPNGSWASWRVTMSRGVPPPNRTGETTDRVRRSGRPRPPASVGGVGRRPPRRSSSQRVNAVRSGHSESSVGQRRGLLGGRCENSHLRRTSTLTPAPTCHPGSPHPYTVARERLRILR
jgi:hypothetical protein